jgi:hypothetical protein
MAENITRYCPFYVDYVGIFSLFCILYSLFSVLCSPFSILCSLFSVHHTFVVRYSGSGFVLLVEMICLILEILRLYRWNW